MELIVIHKHKDGHGNAGGLLRFALSSRPVAAVTLAGLGGGCRFGGRKDVCIAAPAKWLVKSRRAGPAIIGYEQDKMIHYPAKAEYRKNSGVVISNGRFATSFNWKWLSNVLNSVAADIVIVNISPALAAYREKVRITPDSKVVGFRRWYLDSAQPAEIPPDWPHHLFIRTGVFEDLLVDGDLTLDFERFLSRCRAGSLSVTCLDAAGSVLDLETKMGLLTFLAGTINSKNVRSSDKHTIADSARLFGKIITGRNVYIGENVVVSGPAILADGVRIGDGAVVKSSIIGPGVSLPQDEFVQNCVLTKEFERREQSAYPAECNTIKLPPAGIDCYHTHNVKKAFRIWSGFSYAVFFKRIFDIIGASIVLALFAPVFPIIALVIKLTSPGPVFYRARRDGLYGRPFDCLKFRSMAVGADEIQERLRVVSQVDGPQFKMEKDPRVSAVGQFLRDTYLDEIPQFINVFMGQMSIVGPRPSPERENSLCPHWRDARLSVRPGITGLWQIRRTRAESRDFQEWLYYDTEYVRNLSFRLDLWVCRKTARKLITNFVDQF